jgi:oxygen-independent coproporphyrinogen III oxidase
MRGLYIHVPFCVSKCAYCDFYSLPGRLDCLDNYVNALLKETTQYGRLSFETLFLGGGTPSLLGPVTLHTLLKGLKRQFRFSKLQEATLEANPESLSRELLDSARENGINRLSIGVQSLSNIELKKVGRIHTAEEAIQAIESAQVAGFDNISADLILGLPGQDWQSLALSIETLTAQDIQHLSLYCLALEPHTPLSANPPPDLLSDDAQAELYEQAVALLKKRRFVQYEISNFALPGYECLHNLNYWHAGEYIGLGPAAASYYKGLRYKNKPDLDAYLSSPLVQKDEVEKLDKPARAAEEAILRLRLLQEGLDLNQLIEKYGDKNIIPLAARLNKLSTKYYLQRNGSNYYLNPAQALVSNSILSELMGD